MVAGYGTATPTDQYLEDVQAHASVLGIDEEPMSELPAFLFKFFSIYIMYSFNDEVVVVVVAL